MKMKRQILVLCVVLIAMLVSTTASGGEWKQKDFVELWQKIRTVIVEENLEEFKKLTIAPEPEAMANMTKEDFAEMVEFFLIDAFPEWSTVKLLKFEQKEKTALLVLQLHDANPEWKEWIAISAYTFLLTEEGWKLSGNLYDKSLGKSSDAKKNQLNIEEELKENSDLQLKKD